jgi:hypothetical protein
MKFQFARKSGRPDVADPEQLAELATLLAAEPRKLIGVTVEVKCAADQEILRLSRLHALTQNRDPSDIDIQRIAKMNPMLLRLSRGAPVVASAAEVR